MLIPAMQETQFSITLRSIYDATIIGVTATGLRTTALRGSLAPLAITLAGLHPLDLEGWLCHFCTGMHKQVSSNSSKQE